MFRKKRSVWISLLRNVQKNLHFASLDESTRDCVERELFYFNNRRVVVLAWAILVIEALNIINVLFMSKSGLATANNRQYFLMYVLLFVSGAAGLMLRRLFRDKQKLLLRCYTGFTLFWVVWHAVLTAMDLRKNPNVTVFVTAMFGLSFLIRMKPMETLCIFPSGFLILVVCAGRHLTGGTAINAGIAVMVAIFVACSRYFGTLEEIGYRKKLVQQAAHRVTEKQKLNLLYEQQSALLACSRDLLFLWDKKENRLLFSGGCGLSKEDRDDFLIWIGTYDEKHSQRPLNLTLENGKNQPGTYIASITLQSDLYGEPVGAVGRLTLLQESMKSIRKGMKELE